MGERGGPVIGSGRRHDLDWLRAVAIVSVVLFHAGVAFTTPAYGLSGVEVSRPLYEFCFFFHQWRMPLLFCVSGSAAWIALRRRTARQFVEERTRRLLVPVGFGIVVLLPPVHWRSAGAREPFVAFYPHVLDAMFGGRYVDWGHLWFIVNLFVVDLIALPALLWLNSPAGARWLRRAVQWLERPGAVAGLAFPLAVAACVPSRWVAGWVLAGVEFKPVLGYLLLYVFGFALASAPAARAAIVARRHQALAVALTVQLLRYLLRSMGGEVPGSPPAADPNVERATLFIGAVTGWLWVVVALSYAAHHLQFENRGLRYLRARSYAIYLVHQPVLVLLAAPVVYWRAPVGVRFAVLSALTLAITLLIYELLINRSDAVRFAMGQGARPRGPRADGDERAAAAGGSRRAA